MGTILGDKVTISHELGSCAFNDPASLSQWPSAVYARMDVLDGWADTADLNVIRTPRGVGDGDYTADRFPFKSRMLIVEGYIKAAGRTALDALWDLLVVQAFPDNTDIMLTRFESTPKYVVCRLAGPIELSQYFGTEGDFRFHAALLCADPFKYDAVNTILGGPVGVAGISSGGRSYPRTYPLAYSITASGAENAITVYNAGTTNAYPTITIHGPLPSGWRVENATTGEHLSFAADLLAGDTLVIDNYAKSASLNGSTISGLISGKWWSLRPMSNTIRLYGNYDPAANFSVTAKSVWR